MPPCDFAGGDRLGVLLVAGGELTLDQFDGGDVLGDSGFEFADFAVLNGELAAHRGRDAGVAAVRVGSAVWGLWRY